MRTPSAGFNQAAVLPQAGALFFVEAQFTTGTIRATTWGAERDWNGFVWSGIGEVLSVSPPQESQATAAQRFEVSLSGLKSDLLSAALGNPSVYRGRPINIWFQIIDTSGAELDFGAGSVQPELYIAGYMNVSAVSQKDGKLEIRIECSTQLPEPAPSQLAFNAINHKALYPNELMLDRQATLAGQPTTWLTARFQRIAG